MEPENKLSFLRELAKAGEKANMWQAGQALGLDRHAVETLCLDLISAGVLEMVSLSGTVRLTESGLAQLRNPPPIDQPADLPALITAIAEAGDMGLSPLKAADLAADLATLRPQLTRSQPLKAVVKACLGSIYAILGQAESPQAQRLAAQARAFLE
jgi:hypothetical protein